MSDINYEIEVKKVYPDAAVAPMGAFGITMAYFVEDLATGERLGKSTDYEGVWIMAYDKLVKEGKI